MFNENFDNEFSRDFASGLSKFQVKFTSSVMPLIKVVTLVVGLAL